jgi:hypothetical protein
MSRSCIVVSCATNRLHRLVQTTRQTSEISLIDSRGNPAGRIHASRHYRTICRTMYRTIGYRCSSSHSRYIVRYTAVNCHAACDVSGKCLFCVIKLHGRKSRGDGGDESPQNLQWGDAHTDCPPQIFVVFQNFKRSPWIRPPQISTQVYATAKLKVIGPR